MDGRKNNSGTIGNKGGGRNSHYEEHNKTQAVNSLWEKVNNKVQANDKLTEYEEKLVLAVLPKTIKTNTDITTKGEKIETIVGFNYIKPNEEDNPDN